MILNTLEQTLGKSCVIGLSYFNHQDKLLKQSMLGGKVIKANIETGITVELAAKAPTAADQAAHFILPAELSCWFVAPQGDFHTNDEKITISNPDYLITWDIFQSQNVAADGEQQWWHWQPRTTSPMIK